MQNLPPVPDPDSNPLEGLADPRTSRRVLHLTGVEVAGETRNRSGILRVTFGYDPEENRDPGFVSYYVSVPAAYRIARELDKAVRSYIGMSDDEGI